MATPAPPSNEIFSGLNFSGQAAPAATQSAEADFFGGAQASAPPRGDVGASRGADPFGSFQSGPSSKQTAGPLSDLFGGMSLGPTSQNAPRSPVDLLGGLQSAPASQYGNSAPQGRSSLRSKQTGNHNSTHRDRVSNYSLPQKKRCT